MGKPTGFIDYNRQTAEAVAPKERIHNFNEFHTPLPKEEQQKQGARCMACGVPFCQSGMEIMGMTSGCPLHNLVPEWNDLVYTGNWEQAYSRLKKTNNFPEFTARVCPALCEAACTCGNYGDAVSVKENEFGIIENAYEQGFAKAQPPKVRTGKTVAIVGSGPSGLAAAFGSMYAAVPANAACAGCSSYPGRYLPPRGRCCGMRMSCSDISIPARHIPSVIWSCGSENAAIARRGFS